MAMLQSAATVPTDLRVTTAQGRQILYLPGDIKTFRAFDTPDGSAQGESLAGESTATLNAESNIITQAPPEPGQPPLPIVQMIAAEPPDPLAPFQPGGTT